jgi:hypothetical protein
VKRRIVVMADETQSETVESEVGKLEVRIGDRVILVDPSTNPKLISQLDNLEAQQKEEEFSQARTDFTEAAVQVVNEEITSEMASALEDMCLVIPLDGTTSVLKDTQGAVLVLTKRVKIGVRGPREKKD